MNDLDLLRDTAPDAPLPSLSDLSGPRQRVVTGIAVYGEQDRHALPPPAAERRWRKRHGPAARLAIGGVTVAAAAAITAGVLVGTHGAAPAARSGGTAPAVVPAQLTAREVLARAARAALSEPAVVPRTDQFVYTKVGGGPGQSVVQTWLSVDGKRNGMVVTTSPRGKVQSSAISGCPTGELRFRLPGIGGKPLHLGGKPVTAEQYKQEYGTSVPMDGPVVTTHCTPVLAYFPDMPTSASAMASYLQQTQGIQPGNLNDLAKTVGFMLQSDYILPAQRAALYEFLATTPGLIVEPHVRDISGRPGVGVGWSFEGSKAVNIFDPGTYAYLGLTTWGEQGQEGGDALLQTAIVSRPGQLP